MSELSAGKLIALIPEAHGVNDSDLSPGTGEIGTANKIFAEITAGWNFFELDVALVIGTTYHNHIKYNGTATIIPEMGK